MKEWKVYFEGSFWGHRGRDHAGREILLNRSFWWGERLWTVPAVYVCARGLVMDLCVSTEEETMAAFVEKWLPYERKGDIPEEVREEMERQHPLRMDVHARLCCNGHHLREKHASGCGWMPEACLPDGYQNPPMTEDFMSHYGLDRKRAWSFRRIMFPWTTRRGQRQIQTLSLQLNERTVSFPGPHFESGEEKITFLHPLSGEEYTLTILGEEEHELPEGHFQREDLEYPRKCLTIGYAVEPPYEGVQVCWTGQGDAPRAKTPDPNGPTASHAAGVIMLQKGSEKSAASALYFTLPEKREWRIVLQEKLTPDGEWMLISEEIENRRE